MNKMANGRQAQNHEACHIVGAGPAGLASAIVLAKAGRKVVIHDRRKHSGDRFHNDFQGLENWSTLSNILTELAESGIESNFDCQAVRTGTAYDAWNNAYSINSREPLYYLVRRGNMSGSLDSGLYEQASKLGIEVRYGERVDNIESPAILAIGPRTADAIAVGYIFETDMEDGNWICFNDELAPLGYAYLLISGGHGTVASCMFTGFKNQKYYLDNTIQFFRTHANLTMTSPRPFGGYGNFRLPRTAVQGGKPVVGEQAGFQDSLAGFGMTYALRSGILAARSWLDGTDYTRLWHKELLPLLRTSVCNRFLFNLVGARGRRWALARHIGNGDAREALARLYQPWWLSRLIYPLARLRYRAPLKDKSCDHINCSCVWCQHGGTLLPDNRPGNCGADGAQRKGVVS